MVAKRGVIIEQVTYTFKCKNLNGNAFLFTFAIFPTENLANSILVTIFANELNGCVWVQ